MIHVTVAHEMGREVVPYDSVTTDANATVHAKGIFVHHVIVGTKVNAQVKILRAYAIAIHAEWVVEVEACKVITWTQRDIIRSG